MSADWDEIRRERRSRGMTQKQLAAATGVGLRTITRGETGEAERDGKDADSASLIVLQRYLHCGPYTPETGRSDDPPLSKASFSELVQALVSKHGQEVRDAVTLALSEGRTVRPRNGMSGVVVPRFNAAELDDPQEPGHGRPNATG